MMYNDNIWRMNMVIIDDYKINPNKKIIDDIAIQVIYIPLESKMGYKYKETVKVGDYVCIGSILGKNTIAEIPLLSSVSGTVVGFEEKLLSNNHSVRCVVIENDFKEKYQDKIGKKYDITKYSKDEFIYLLKKCAITGMSGSGFPTYIKYENKDNLDYLIVDGCECEIYASADNARMYNNPEEILEGIDAIMEIMNIPKAYIAINEKNEVIIDKFLRHINTYPNIKIYPVTDGYPNGYERLLVKEILGLTYDRLPLEVGVINENVSTIYAIYAALKYHKPLVDRIVTISGEGIKNPGNYLLKVGTNFNELLLKTNIAKEIANPMLIVGGAMMGTSISDDNLIITSDVNCILIKENKELVPTPCLKCGKCSEVCPMGLIPSLIISSKDKAKKFKIDKCVNCGLCSYVCPSKIEVREIIKKMKEELK